MLRKMQQVIPVLMRLRPATLIAMAGNRTQAVTTRAAAVRCLCLSAPLEIVQGKSMADRRRSVRTYYRL